MTKYNAIHRAVDDYRVTGDAETFLASLRANGYAVVPRDATDEMVHAWDAAMKTRPLVSFQQCYAAMLAAAEGKQEDRGERDDK